MLAHRTCAVLIAIGLSACSDAPPTETDDPGSGGASTSSAGPAQGTGASGGGQGGSSMTCSDHLLDCDGAPGCETDILADAQNCGGCGHACEPGPNGTPACAEASCTLDCVDGFLDCNGAVTDGCETDPLTSVWNCGECGTMCLQQANSTPSCVAGDCAHTCDAGYDDCNGDPSDGCEVQLTTHPSHCGACGNVCPSENGTALCTLGNCAVELTVAGSNVRDIAVNGGFVYFANGSDVRRVPLGGGSSQLLGSGGAGTVAAIALSGSSVYFLHGGFGLANLFAVPASGGSVTLVAALVPDTFWNPESLAADSTHAYWIESNTVYSIPLSGGSPTTWNTSADDGPAVGSGGVYWTGFNGGVFGMPSGGGAVTTVLNSPGSKYGIAIDSGLAYVASFNVLERVPLTGGTAQLLASGLDPTYYMATDGLHVYLYTSAGEIVRVPAAGGTPLAIASVYNPSLNYGRIAVDGTHVYWAGQNRIYKMPK